MKSGGFIRKKSLQTEEKYTHFVYRSELHNRGFLSVLLFLHADIFHDEAVLRESRHADHVDGEVLLRDFV